jgi:hypothetical protein
MSALQSVAWSSRPHPQSDKRSGRAVHPRHDDRTSNVARHTAQRPADDRAVLAHLVLDRCGVLGKASIAAYSTGS